MVWQGTGRRITYPPLCRSDISQATSAGVRVRSYNESRVLVQFPGGWKVVHVHKSPAYRSPLDPPGG